MFMREATVILQSVNIRGITNCSGRGQSNIDDARLARAGNQRSFNILRDYC